MDGFDLARKLHATAGLESVKLVAVTGYGQAVDRQRSREAGFAEHLVKPVDWSRSRSCCAAARSGDAG